MWYVHRINDTLLPWVCTISLVVIAWSLSGCSTYKSQSDYGVNWKTRKDKVTSEPFNFNGYTCTKGIMKDINCVPND